MKQGTLFLKIAVFFIGVPVLILGIFLLLKVTAEPVNPEYAHILYPIIIVLFISAIPFYFALYQSWKLLNYIDQNEAFTALSTIALKKIKNSASTISVLYVIILPFVYLLADKDDAPGLIFIGMVPIFASIVIAVFAAVLQKLLQTAITIKAENELTI